MSSFGSVVAHPDLDGEVSGLSMGQTKDFTGVLTDPQPVLVIMSSSKGKGAALTLYNGPPDKGGIIQRTGMVV